MKCRKCCEENNVQSSSFNWQLVDEHNVFVAPVSRLVQWDLGMRWQSRVTKQLISRRHKLSKLDRARKFLNWIKSKNLRVSYVWVFSWEKFLRWHGNQLSDLTILVYEKSNDVNIFYCTLKSNFPDSVAILGVVASDGRKMDLNPSEWAKAD